MYNINEIKNRAFTINQRKKISKFKDKSSFDETIQHFEGIYSVFVDNDQDNVRRIFTIPSDKEMCLLLFFLFFKKKFELSELLKFSNDSDSEQGRSINMNGKEEIILTTEEERQWGTDIQEDFYWFMNNIIENDNLDSFLVKAAKEYIDRANQKEYNEILDGYIGVRMDIDDRFYAEIRSVIKRDFEKENYIEKMFQKIWRAIITPHANMDYVECIFQENFQRLEAIVDMLKQDRNFAISSIYNTVETHQDRFDENDLKNVSGIIDLFYVERQKKIVAKLQSELDELRANVTEKAGNLDWIISVIG